MKLVFNVLMALMLVYTAQSSAEEVSEPASVLDKFRAALIAGDTETIKEVLSKDVLIYEGAGVERSLAEYEAHHLPSDIKFSQAVKTELLERKTYTVDDLAVITSRYSVSGSYKGRDIDLTMNETITVANIQDSGWKIIRIHWSN